MKDRTNNIWYEIDASRKGASVDPVKENKSGDGYLISKGTAFVVTGARHEEGRLHVTVKVT